MQVGPLVPPPPPTPDDFARLRAELAASQADPWLASLFMRRLGTLRARLSDLRAWLASLPRRSRRAWARGWGRRRAQAVLLATLLLVLAAGDARAATITVDPGGSGCTLRDAITAANTDTATGSCPTGSGPDTINFDAANGVYLLDTTYGVALPVINTAITIQGNGNTTLDAEGAFRVLHVSGGSLGLANATITGGRSPAIDSGAGIYVRSGTLTVTSTTISGNSTDNDGGGIYLFDGTLTVTSATISDNSAADSGGGIRITDGTLSVTDATISGNTPGSSGGGLEAIFVSASLTSTTVSGNSAGSHGGGLRFANSTVSLTDVTVSGNSTSNVHYGGGIYLRGGSASLTGATISGNSAGEDGGGLWVYEATATLEDSTVSGNTSGRNGGGSFVNNGRLYARRSTVSGNSATVDGGGMFFGAFVSEVANSTISGNSAGGTGGGIRNADTTLRLTHSTVAGNSAASGAGGISNGEVTIVSGSIVADQAAGPDCANTSILASLGNSLESATSCGFSLADDVQNGNADLGPLADNGGPTFTHALGAASEAREAGDNAVCAAAPVDGIDQRGVTRPQPGGGDCDIGAFEAGAFTLTVVLAGSGSGTVASAPAGIACPGTCAAPFDGIVSLTPLAGPGSEFAGWSGDCTGDGVTEVEVLDDRSCTAAFDTRPAPTAAEIIHFAAAPDPTGRIRLTWETASEPDLLGFQVQRAPADPQGPPGRAQPDAAWTPVGALIPARGSAARGANYAITDAPGLGSFAYRLVLVEADGPAEQHGPVGAVVRALRAFLPFASSR